MKTAERAHTPRDLWERVKLHPNLLKAVEQIDRHLAYWPEHLVSLSKKRLLRIHQYLLRMRRMRSQLRLELVPVNKTLERRDLRREQKAHTAANLQDSIKHELLERLKSGTYGDLYDDIVNFPQREFDSAVGDLEDLDKDEDIDALGGNFVEAYDDDEDAEEDEDDESELQREVEYEYELEGAAREKLRAKKRVAPGSDEDDDDEDSVQELSGDDDEEEEEEEEDDKPQACPPPKMSFAERARAARGGVKPAALVAPAAAAAVKRGRKGHVTLDESD